MDCVTSAEQLEGGCSRATTVDRLPDFLIVGTMKAGTTTLYHDLQLSSGIFLSTPKEPQCLCWDRCLTDEGRAEYASYFKHAKAGQLCGEASVMYTAGTLPDACARRAGQLLSADTRIIYLVREPLAKTVSAHRMLCFEGYCEEDFESAVRNYSRLIRDSQYHRQIMPWVEVFGRDRVHIERFEEYIANRQVSVDRICRFLGIKPVSVSDTNARHNAAVDREHDYRRVGGRVRQHRLYHLASRADFLRLLPSPLKPMGGALASLSTPSSQSISLIRKALRDDLLKLRALMGRNDRIWPDSPVEPD